jgi:2',3'-cyclic-nucleotide 2'-phosphodiesterase (5'-nucleotidase family)
MEATMKKQEPKNSLRRFLSAMFVLLFILTTLVTQNSDVYSIAKADTVNAAVPVKKVELKIKSATLYLGGTDSQSKIKLQATLSPENPSNSKVVFESSNTKIATVNQDGLVTAKAIGTATVTATAADVSNKKASVKITVKKLDSSEVSLLKREKAAVLLVDAFKLVEIKALDIEGFENTPKELGYESTSGAINSANIIAAAKDCIDSNNRNAVETMINSTVMELMEDGLSFDPTKTLSEKEFATYIAKALYGPDLEIDHLKKAIADGIFDSNLSDRKITVGLAKELLKFTKSDDFQVLTMFATADIHGNLVPYTSNDRNFQIGSVARISTILNEARENLSKSNVLYVDAGDSPYNTALASLTNGEVSIAVLDRLNLDATVLGNHDFDYGFVNLLQLARHANYSMLSANTYYKDDTYPEELEPYIIENRGGVTVGIFGITDDESASTTLYSNTKDIKFYEDIETAKQVVGILKNKKKCDIIVALSHLHSKNKALLEQVNGIDISIGGGNDIAGRPEIINNTWLINPGKHAEALNQINLNLYKGKLIGTLYNQIFLTEAYEEDENINKIINSYQKQVDASMSKVVGYLDNSGVEWSTELVRTQCSTIGNLVPDALLAYTKDYSTTIAFQNGGGIRAALPGGDVTLQDIYGTLPFDNEIIVVEMSGQTIWDTLENGVSSYPSGHGKFLQVAGIKYTFNASKEVGSRIQKVQLANGEDISKETTYRVVINSYLAGAGDGYTMLNLLNTGIKKADNVKVIAHLNTAFLRDALVEYFVNNSSKEKPLALDSENRITIMK